METTAYRPSRASRALDTEQVTSHRETASYIRERAEEFPHDPIPLFLSDPNGEPAPEEYASYAERRRIGLTTQIVAGALAVAAIAVLVALFQSDVSRMLAVNAKTSLVAGDTAAAPPVRQIALKDPARLSGPMLASADATVAAAPVTPSREAIATAYQAALQTQAAAPVQAPSIAPAAPATIVKTLDAETLAGLMTRAKSLMAVGDIAAARLLLERAANAQDASAAFVLAQTYDPAVLGTSDTRSIIADAASARDWYRKAAQLGSAEARQRLAQFQD